MNDTKNKWHGNVERITELVYSHVQPVELVGEERKNFFAAVANSYEPALYFALGGVYTDGTYLYGDVLAYDSDGRQIFDEMKMKAVTYPSRVRIPNLIEDNRECDSVRRWIPGDCIDSTKTPLYPNISHTILPDWA